MAEARSVANDEDHVSGRTLSEGHADGLRRVRVADHFVRGDRELDLFNFMDIQADAVDVDGDPVKTRVHEHGEHGEHDDQKQDG